MSRNTIADRGSELALFYPTVFITNARNERISVPGTVPIRRWVMVSNDRSSIAELIGQVDNEVLKCSTRDLPNVDSWSRIEFRDKVWDLATPPARSKFTRNTTHVEMIFRSRNQKVAP